MGFVFSGIFFGLFFVLLGIAICIKIFLKIELPIGRLFGALFFILLGIGILIDGFKLYKHPQGWMPFGGPGPRPEHGFHPDEFSDDFFRQPPGDEKDIDVVFYGRNIDLSKLTNSKREESYRINVIFGKCDVELNRSNAVIIRASSAFAKADFPDDTMITFGNYLYKSKNFDSATNTMRLRIEANVVFGKLGFYFK